MKKMRKLIPAFAMLMVAAIMMTTASFAWFTMNEQVEVSGMQIKAKSAGSLIISQAAIWENALGSDSVEVSTGVKNLFPMTYNTVTGTTVKGAQLTSETANGWYKPTSNAGNNVVTGAAAGGMSALTTNEIGSYTYDEIFYLATAGDAINNGSLTVSFGEIAAAANNGEAYKAYAAAIYVFEKANWGTFNSLTSVPAAIIFADNAKDASGADTTRNSATITGVNIPSIAGAVSAETAVGLQVVVRFYVDGALSAQNADGSVKTTYVNAGYIYTQDKGAYSNQKNYEVVTETDLPDTYQVGNDLPVGAYVRTVDTNGKIVYTPATGKVLADTKYVTIATSEAIVNDAILSGNVPDTWFTKTVNQVLSSYTYVRTADAPSAATSLTINFGTVLAD